MEPITVLAKCGAASVGAKSESVPIAMDREVQEFQSLDDVERLFVNRRLSVSIVVGKDEDMTTTKSLFKEDSDRVIAECGGFSVREKKITATLNFAANDLKAVGLKDFAHKVATKTIRITIHNAEEIAEPEPEAAPEPPPHPDVEAGKHRPHGTPALDALVQAMKAPDQQSVSVIVGETLAAKLADENIRTVYQFQQHIEKCDAADVKWELPGIGPSKQKKFRKKLETYLAEYEKASADTRNKLCTAMDGQGDACGEVYGRDLDECPTCKSSRFEFVEPWSCDEEETPETATSET